jgi:hypothetical protein
MASYLEDHFGHWLFQNFQHFPKRKKNETQEKENYLKKNIYQLNKKKDLAIQISTTLRRK